MLFISYKTLTRTPLEGVGAASLGVWEWRVAGGLRGPEKESSCFSILLVLLFGQQGPFSVPSTGGGDFLTVTA